MNLITGYCSYVVERNVQKLRDRLGARGGRVEFVVLLENTQSVGTHFTTWMSPGTPGLKSHAPDLPHQEFPENAPRRIPRAEEKDFERFDVAHRAFAFERLGLAQHAGPRSSPFA